MWCQEKPCCAGYTQNSGGNVELLENSHRQLASGLFRLQELAKGHSTFCVLRDMEGAQWLSPEQLLQVQEQRLRQFLADAAQDVPYYRDKFHDLHLLVKDVRGTADLGMIPCLTKQDIRENLEPMKSVRARKVSKFATGGSTGQPLIFYLGPTRVSSDVAARLRAEAWFDVGIGDREYAIWGSPLELTKQDRLRNIRDWVFRTQLLPAFEMSPATMTRYLDQMSRTKCRRIFGYPSSIALLCEHAGREGRDLRGLGVRVVFVTAEYLQEEWRRTIEKTFGCPVANGYGGRDSGFVAQECPAGGMHITADRLIVEVVDEQGCPLPLGQTGEIVVTNLDTPEMPFIRYRTGDIGALASKLCSCGRTLPLLERVEGRKTDFVVAPDGRIMHGLSLIYVIREIEGIAGFRIIQKQLTEFEVDIAPTDGYDPHSENRIREGFRRRLRAPVGVQIRYSDAIPALASGKARYVISEVAPSADAVYESKPQGVDALATKSH